MYVDQFNKFVRLAIIQLGSASLSGGSVQHLEVYGCSCKYRAEGFRV